MPKMKISDNFTYEEMINSPTAKKNGINNTPDEKSKANIIRLVKEVLQPLRDEYQKPIVVTSGYRCYQLNKLVGGSTTSQHLLGQAADIISNNNSDLFNLVKQMIADGRLKVGQLIDEKGLSWIHISLPSKKHENQILHL